MQYASQCNVFANFNVRKKPTITYKRKPRFAISTPLEDNDSAANENIAPFKGWSSQNHSITEKKTTQPLLNDACLESTVDLQGAKVAKDDNNSFSVFDYPETNIERSSVSSSPGFLKEEKLDVFDFPETDPGSMEVKLMVANASKSQPACTPKKVKAQRKIKVQPNDGLESSASLPTPTKRIQMMERSHSDSIIIDSRKNTPSQPNDNLTTTYSGSLPFEIVTDTHSCASQSASSTHTSQKRKLGLVSRLRSANGEFSTVSSRARIHGYDFLDSDEEEDQALFDEPNLTFGQADDALHIVNHETPVETTYEERMERELASIMRTEFGEDNEEPGLQPEATKNSSARELEKPNHARVTYKRSTRHFLGAMSPEDINDPLHALLSELRESTGL